MNAGGERYEYIAALNAQSGHIKMLLDIVESESRQWMAELERYNTPEQMDVRQRRAVELGAEG